MNRMRKSMSVAVLAAVGAAGVMFGNGLLRDVQFARAEGQVQTSREELSKAEDLSTVFRNVGKVVEPSVVNIEVHKTVKNTMHHSLPFNDDQLRQFFKDHGQDLPDMPNNDNGNGNGGDDEGSLDEIGTGSGVIMEVDGSDAYILTNNHVAGGADEMTVTLSDGKQIKGAKTVGADPKSDLAVVKIKADHLIPAEWGDSDQLQKGDWIMAFGSPFGYIGSMTHGIVSATNRHDVGILDRQQGYENFIQVDAPINPGNSGGPLVDVHGKVVGINTAIASRSGGFQGIGFAIPSDQAKVVYEQLKAHGKMVRGYLGVGIASVDDPRVGKIAESFGYTKSDGVIVQQTFEGTPATGKLEEGDIITAMNGKAVKDVQQLRNAVADTAPGKEITFSVFRDKKNQDVKIKIGEQPEEMGLPTHGKHGANSDQNNADNGKSSVGLGLTDISDELRERFGIDANIKGALVREVDPKSPAAKEGIRPGDVITKVGSDTVTSAKEAKEALSNADLSKGVRLYVVSKDASRFVFLQSDKSDK